MTAYSRLALIWSLKHKTHTAGKKTPQQTDITGFLKSEPQLLYNLVSLAEDSTANICRKHQLGRWAVHSEKVCGDQSRGAKKSFGQIEPLIPLWKQEKTSARKKNPSQLYNQNYFWYTTKDFNYPRMKSYSLVKWERNPWEIAGCKQPTTWDTKCWQGKQKQFWSCDNKDFKGIPGKTATYSYELICQARSNLWPRRSSPLKKHKLFVSIETKQVLQNWTLHKLKEHTWQRHPHSASRPFCMTTCWTNKTPTNQHKTSK